MKKKTFDFFEKNKQKERQENCLIPNRLPKYNKVNEREQDQVDKLAVRLFNVLGARTENKYKTPKVETCKDVLNLLVSKFGFYPVKRTILFYFDNINEDFIPEITSPTKFKLYYKDISQIASKATRTSEVFSEEEKKLKEELIEKLDFKGVLISKLPLCLEKSLREYKVFYKKFLILKEKEIPSRIKKFMAFLEEAGYIVPNHVNFIKSWIFTIHSYFENWTNWEPKITPYEFSIYSDYFEKIGYQWSQEYCCSNELWNDLIREIIYTKDQTTSVVS